MGLHLLIFMIASQITFSHATQMILQHQPHRTSSSVTLNFVLRGKRSHLSEVIRTINGITAPQCSVNCFMAERCQSVNFNWKKNICQLLDDNLNQTTATKRIVEDPDWNYYGYKVFSYFLLKGNSKIIRIVKSSNFIVGLT